MPKLTEINDDEIEEDEIDPEELPDLVGVQKPVTAESSKSKKKKKNKLKNLLSHKPKDQITEEDGMAQVEKAIQSASLQDKKPLTKDDQKKMEKVINEINKMQPGGKELSDHKFWKTQPVLKFGT